MNNTQETQTLSEEIKAMFTGMKVDGIDDEMRDYIVAELGQQVIERIMIKLVKDLPEEKVRAFLEFIEKGASQESLYIYLTSIYPKAEEMIQETAREIIEEFKEGIEK